MDNFSQKVIDSFFQPFYHDRIILFRQLGQHYSQLLDIPFLTFWFSVIDFYGGVYFIGNKNIKKTYRDGKLKLTDKETFTNFVFDYFPSPENEMGEFIYTVFRSGLVHQLSPKKGGIIRDANDLKLLRINVDTNNPDNTANKVAILNIYRLEHLAFNAYLEFRRKIEHDELVIECERIYFHLLSSSDGLEDGITIHDQYNKLSTVVQNYLTV